MKTKMATETELPKGDSDSGLRVTPIPPPTLPQPTLPATSIPQKRVMIEDDHVPAVRSPLNPDSKNIKPQPASQEETSGMAREKRTKKESLKKRESKGALAGAESSRATPEPRRKEIKDARDAKSGEAWPMRYKLHGPVKHSDFDQPQGPVFRSHHEVDGPDGRTLEFFETSEQ